MHYTKGDSNFQPPFLETESSRRGGERERVVMAPAPAVGKALKSVGAQEAKVLTEAAVKLIFGEVETKDLLKEGGGSAFGASEALRRIFGQDSEAKERCLASLSGILIDVGNRRASLPDEDVSSFLQSEHLLSPEVSASISGAVREHRARISEALQVVSRSTPLPQLQSVKWRLDVNVGQNDTSKSVREPLFHVNLGMDQRPEDLYFVCNMEEMQDLVSTLKDACLSLKRNEKNYS